MADSVRAILDGHVVLDRHAAEAGRYPAIDVLRSLSRVAPGYYGADERMLVERARRLMRAYADMAELIQLGAYRTGGDRLIDDAIRGRTELTRAADALAVLARVARRALDQERRGLFATDRAVAGLLAQLAALREAALRERLAAGALARGDPRLLAYLSHGDARARGVAAELRRLEQQRENQAARLTERHLELKRLEVLLERRAARLRAERIRCEQQMIDELVVARRQR